MDLGVFYNRDKPCELHGVQRFALLRKNPTLAGASYSCQGVQPNFSDHNLILDLQSTIININPMVACSVEGNTTFPARCWILLPAQAQNALGNPPQTSQGSFMKIKSNLFLIYQIIIKLWIPNSTQIKSIFLNIKMYQFTKLWQHQ